MPQPNIPTVDLSDDDDDHLPTTTTAAAAATTTTTNFINLETPESIPNTRKRHRPSSHSKPIPITLDDDDDDDPPPKLLNLAFATTSFALLSSPLLPTPSPGDDELICVRSDDEIGELGRNSCLKNTEECLQYDVENRGPKLTAMENQSQNKDSDLDRWLDLDSTICLFNGLSPNVHAEGKGGLGKRSIMNEGDTSDHDYEMENVTLEKGGASSSEDKANAEKIQNKENQTTNRKKLREEKNHKKEQERSRKADLKAEALRLKQLEKEKKMLEKFKFSEKHIVAVINQKVLSGSVGGQLVTMFGQKKLTFETPENTFAKSVMWKLKPPEEISQLSTLKTDIHYILLIYDNAEEFCNHANDGSLMHHIASVRKHYPSYTICCLTNRLMSFINKREQQKYKNHKDARDWKRPPVEKLFAKLSIQFANIHIRQCADEAEVAEHVVGLTINLAKCHSRKKLTHLSVNANGCNVPKDCLDRGIIMKHQWLKALVSIPKVQPKYALAIWKQYPTLKSLLRVYMDPNKTDNLKGVDRISDLPEDILLTIVSQLEMKEAAKTSILSKRWRYIWTNLTALDFDYLIVYPECKYYHYYGRSKVMEASKYINWVNQVIRQHRGQSINKFRVQYGFYERYERHFDRWVEFALAKKVKKLELEKLELPLYHCPGENYTLKKLPSLFESINSLTCLRLYIVNVSGELLEYVLAECRHLEEIFVENSDTLVSLKVASSKLKKLSIRYCDSLNKLEIVDAVNLCYLDYQGKPIIEFKSLPLSLDEVVLNGECCRATVPICRQIACVAMQLSKLSVRFMILVEPVICNIPAKSLPCFSNLKFLELTYWRESIVDLPSIIRLLGACPVLSEFKLQVCWLDSLYMPKEARVLQGLEPPPLSLMTREGNNPYVYDHSLEEDKIEYKALPCLRVFQLVGFIGDDDDLNLIQIIFNMAVQLHSFICHPLMPLVDGGITEYEVNESRSRATTLQSLIPPKVNYVITNTYNAWDML